MKKLTIMIALLVGVASASVSWAQAPPVPDFEYRIKGGKIGSLQSTPTRIIVLVRNPIASSDVSGLNSGDPVRWELTSDDGVSIETTTISGDPAFAGILVTDIATSDNVAVTSAFDDIGRGNWGYMIVYGPANATINNGFNAASAGDPFITSTDAGVITGWASDAYNVATSIAHEDIFAKSHGIGGIFLDAPTIGDTSVQVFVGK